MKICTRSLLCTLPALAATSGVALFASATQADTVDRPLAASPNTFVQPSKNAIPYNGGSGIAGGSECSYDNGPPADCFGAPASQSDPVYPFQAESADDFTLTGNGENPCLITNITFWFLFFPTDDSPEGVDMTGVNVTVYEDTINLAHDPNDPTSPPNLPDGEPIDTGGHTNSLVESFVPVSLITFTEIAQPVTGQGWQADMTTVLVLPKNEKLWLALAPEFLFPPQTAISLSQINTGKAALQHFNLLGTNPWAIIAGAADCPDVGLTATDLAFNMTGEKFEPQPPFCPWDCGDNNGNVGVTDLLALLAQWNMVGTSCDQDGTDGVGVTDLLALLAAWGDCPPAVQGNDECADAVVVVAGANDVDLKGTTPSVPDPVCTNPGGDGWYTYSCAAALRVNFVTSINVFIEVYDACGGNLIDCGPGQNGVGPLSMCGPGPDGIFGTADDEPTSVVVRLINDLGLPNDITLKGSLFVTELPALAPESCEEAFELAAGDTVLNDTTGGPDSLSQDCGDATDASTATHWYVIAGDGTTMTVSTCNAGTDPFFDTQLSVFCGDCTLQLLCVGGNNDDGNSDCGNDGFGLQSTVSFCTIPGKNYYVAVHGGVGAFGEGVYELSASSDGVQCTGAIDCGPVNDECDTYIPIFDGLTAYSTLLATTGGPQDGDPTLCSGANANPQCVHDIWYCYEATCSAILTVDTCEDLGGSADYDTDIWVYGPYATVGDIDCDNAALNANVADCNDDTSDFPCGQAAPWHSAATVDVTAGEIYLIRVGGWATEGGDLGTGELQITCADPGTGACCVAGDCTDGVSQADCEAQFGFYAGDDTLCADVTCPDCGDYNQVQHGPDDGWTFGTTDYDIDIRRYESFPWDGSAINAIQVYGIDAFNPGAGFVECVEDPLVADVTFYADAAGAPGAVICTYDDLSITRVDTGVVYAGAFINNQYTATLPSACTPAAGTVWVSIQGEAVGDACWFLWLSSGAGDGASLNEDTTTGTFTTEAFDLSICVNP